MDVFAPISAGIGFANSAYSHNLGRDDARYANEMAIGNWRLQNDYNSPASQVNRLKSAGLNPNLAIGGAMSPSSPIGTATQISHDAPSSFPIGEGIGDYVMQSKQLAMQQQLNAAEVDRIKAEADEIRARTPGHKTDTEIKESEEQRNKLRFEHEQIMNSLDESLKALEADNAIYQRNNRESDREYEVKRRANELKLSEYQYKLAEEELNFAIQSSASRLRSIRLENRGKELSNDILEQEKKKLNAEYQLLLGDFADILPLQECIGQNDDGTFYIKDGKEDELYWKLRRMSKNNEHGRYTLKLFKRLKDWAEKSSKLPVKSFGNK